MERLQKYMAHCGVASRRKCEQLIARGRVRVNDVTVKELGTKIRPGRDIVEVEGKIISPIKEHVYIMLNKPIGYVSTVKDQFGRPTVLDLVKGIEERIYPIGRLDYDSEGLILLTNDGALTHCLTHPRYEINKVYIVTVPGKLTKRDITVINKGIELDGFVTSPADVRLLKAGRGASEYRVVIHEGRNRQVRRMFETVGFKVASLKRIAIGSLQLGILAPGDWRYLKQKETRELFRICKHQNMG